MKGFFLIKMNPKNTIHFFKDINGIDLPKKFTFPFQYVPHKLTQIAIEEVQNYLENQTDFNGGFDKLGKMFGVLVVKTLDNKIAYLVGFSGKIDEKVVINGFVPPIYDTLNPNDFYKLGEKEITKINKQIEDFENDNTLKILKEKVSETIKNSEKDIADFKQKIKLSKKKRDQKRKQQKEILSENEFAIFEQKLKNESIRLNYLFKDLKREWQLKINNANKELTEFQKPLHELKQKRKRFSAELQNKLHKKYCFFNYNKEEQNLLDIFTDVPPAGAGECALPKLLQFAYKNNLKPLAMSEFWWGKSPSSEIRKHKHFYPSCKSKCKPILGFMLQGLEIDENPVQNRLGVDLKIIFEDDYLVVLNKPHGFLSVDGREIKDSVYSRMKAYLPNATGMLMIHRLDMATSGLLVVAKSAEIHKNLQQQFTDRSVKKRYIAILDGTIENDKGIINLPLRVDYHNRPRQLVCYKTGKPAITRYEVIERKNNKTKVYLYPETGRTHQLRVHCAFHLGLNTPILGDVLYGTPKDRLYLHAERLQFIHPVTQKRVSFFCESGFELK